MSRILPRYQRHQEREQDVAKVAAIVLETAPVQTTTVTHATLPGDSRRLRGIPTVARGVAGVSPGTDPYAAMQHWPQR